MMTIVQPNRWCHSRTRWAIRCQMTSFGAMTWLASDWVSLGHPRFRDRPVSDRGLDLSGFATTRRTHPTWNPLDLRFDGEEPFCKIEVIQVV